jgi:hypothetical protein
MSAFRRLVPCLVASVLCAGASTDAAAQDSLEFPLGVRSYGMGETGTGDEYDISNVFFNPAVISFFPGVHVGGSYREYKSEFPGDAKIRNLVAGGGHQWNSRNGGKVGFGAGVVIADVNYGESIATNPEGEVIGTFEEIDRTINVVVGADYWFKENIGLSVGVAPKFWEHKFPGTSPEYSVDKTLWDVGALFSMARPVASGYSIVANLGFGYLNAGNKLGWGGDVNNPPTMVRGGLGFRIASPSRPSMDERFQAELPLWGLAFNFDYQNRTKLTDDQHSYMLGLEANLLRMVFLRYGYTDDQWGDYSESSFGAGLGGTYRRFLIRIDYARTEPRGEADPLNHYGLYVGYSM